MEVDFRLRDAGGEVRQARKTAIVVGRHELIRDLDSGETLLFDLESDPFERTDLSRERSELAGRLAGMLGVRLASMTSPAAPHTRVELGPAETKQLRQLGTLSY